MTGALSPWLERLRNRRVALRIRDGESVLDIGCGRAALLEALRQSGKTQVRYFGVDRIAECIEANRQRHPEQRFEVWDLERGAEATIGERFDAVTMVAIIEHLPCPQPVLVWAASLLKPQGRIILTAPHRGAEKIHAFGARLGLFSKEAAQEHVDELPDRAFFERIGGDCGLRLDRYERFLFGLNQLAVLAKPKDA